MMELMHRAKVRRIDEEVPYYDSGLEKSRSFVLNFLRIIGVNITRVGTSTSGQGLRNTSGTWTSNYDNTGDYGIMPVGGLSAGLPGDDTEGLLLGTGTTSPTVSDYTMETLIDHGTASGDLIYGSTSVEKPATSGSYFQMSVWRGFLNVSGGNITVQEIGLQSYHYYNSANRSDFLLARDLLNFTINDGDAATVEYLVRIT